MDSPSSMTCVLKVNTLSRDWHNKLIDVLKGLQDVSYSIDAQQGLAYITGKVEPHKILRMLGNAGKHVRLSHVHYGNQSLSPARLEICCNNLSPGYSPHQNIDIYGCYYCGRIDDYYTGNDYEFGYFPYGRNEGNHRFNADYPYYQQVIGSPLSRNCNLINRRCCQFNCEQMEPYGPSPVFDSSQCDEAKKVKESCCHIM